MVLVQSIYQGQGRIFVCFCCKDSLVCGSVYKQGVALESTCITVAVWDEATQSFLSSQHRAAAPRVLPRDPGHWTPSRFITCQTWSEYCTDLTALLANTVFSSKEHQKLVLLYAVAVRRADQITTEKLFLVELHRAILEHILPMMHAVQRLCNSPPAMQHTPLLQGRHANYFQCPCRRRPCLQIWSF